MTAAMTKQEQRAAERQRYIETTTPIAIDEDSKGAYAVVPSEDGSKTYRVHFAEPKDGANYATSCQCPDNQYRGHRCKHCEIVDAYFARIHQAMHRLPAASVVVAAKSDKVSEVATSPKKAKQPRRSAPNPVLVASLQLAEGTKICKARRGDTTARCHTGPPGCHRDATGSVGGEVLRRLHKVSQKPHRLFTAKSGLVA